MLGRCNLKLKELKALEKAFDTLRMTEGQNRTMLIFTAEWSVILPELKHLLILTESIQVRERIPWYARSRCNNKIKLSTEI